MIPILRFREWCIELINEVNADTQLIDHLVMGVKEEHIIKKLRDKSGVCLCVNYPDASGSGEEDNVTDDHTVYFFVVQKINPGTHTEDEEMKHYDAMQFTMSQLRSAVRASAQQNCIGVQVSPSDKVEWEYQIFGGFNGLSLGAKITDISHG